ncbi:recombination-associated protein RdgC [Desulfuromonas acetoxidans]|uniref:recombination-associated protein RdgC n=1 Tax=Desulfuromonas acetoxidans TaxID=891 RepID=UPI002930AAFE|nr:recombination-associated protein RdgC [Desulfuromonas acetoxidans]
MGLLSNTVSISQFDVVGDFPEGDLAQWVGEKLAEHAFSSIENSAEELALGWVELDDFQAMEFSDPSSWWRDDYVAFTLRRDQRRLPSALVKGELQREQQRFLAENPTYQRVPKDKNDELKELVRNRLLVRVLPSPSLMDVVWNLRTGRLTFASVSTRAMDDLTDLFQKTFVGLRLVSVYPMQRARLVTPDALQDALAAENPSAEGSVMEQIRDNQWLGSEFLMWLLYGTTNARSDYQVTCDGPAAAGERFVAYLDNRFLLTGQGNEGAQKVTVVGPQDRFEEVRVALRQGKEVGEATIHMEKLEHQWRLTLKGELFQFGSFKCPTVRIEKGAELEDERLAVFYERMHVLEEGLQLFDSLLAAFLAERLGGQWGQRCQQINQWLEPE